MTTSTILDEYGTRDRFYPVRIRILHGPSIPLRFVEAHASTKWHSVITERPCAGTARMFDSDPNATASSDPLRGEPLC